jgi:phosphate transport system substrate-binding protein
VGDVVWSIVLPAVGIAIPVFAFLWEFMFVGRKRLENPVKCRPEPK